MGPGPFGVCRFIARFDAFHHFPHFNGFEAYCSRTAALKSTAQQAAATFWRLPSPFRLLIAAAKYLGSGASDPTVVLVGPYRGFGSTLPWFWSDPTVVLVGPYRGFGPTLPWFWSDPSVVLVGPFRGFDPTLPWY